jgi:hypothetical protein
MTGAPSRVLVFAALCFTACTGAVSGHPDDGTAGAPSDGGTTGSAGGPGVAGASGAAGSVGTAGAAGTTGGAGSLAGAAGSDATGAAGAGAAGTTGAAGTAGTSGAAGRGGTTGNAGTSGSAGRGGTTAGAGATGAAGTTGTAGTTGAAGASGSGDPPGYVPALIGVGYGGIRIVSRDGGKTWGDRAYETTNGGDDDVLLRAVTYGNGLWVATGWKLWTSTDGVKWTDHGKLQDGPIKSCSIVEGLAFKDGSFLAACTPWNSPSTIFRSSDGVTWSKFSTIGDTGGHLFLTYRGGKLVAYGDTMTSYQSDDGLTWTTMAGINQATYCENTWKSQTDCKDSSWFDGTYLRADWQGKISRSTNGTSFTTVYNDDQRNTLYQSRAIAAGFVAPP